MKHVLAKKHSGGPFTEELVGEKTFGGRGATRPDFGRGRTIKDLEMYPFLVPIFPTCINELCTNFSKVHRQHMQVFQKLA